MRFEILEKGAEHKYIRRIPTGNPKRPWKYIYKVSAKEATKRDVEAGEKVRITEGTSAGHYEVKEVHENGWVTIRHDETGNEISIRKDHFQNLFFTEHAEKADEYRRKLGDAYDKAKEGSKRKAQIYKKLEAFDARFPDPVGQAMLLQAKDLGEVADKAKTKEAHAAVVSAVSRAFFSSPVPYMEHDVATLENLRKKHQKAINQKAAEKPKTKPAKRVGAFGTKSESYSAILEALEDVPPDFVQADTAYRRFKGEERRGSTQKPPPYEGGELDAANEILNLSRDKRVSSPREAWDKLTSGVKSWNDPRVFDALEIMRQIPGYENTRLPDRVSEWVLDQAEKDNRKAEEEYAKHLKMRAAKDSVVDKDDDFDDSFDFGANVEKSLGAIRERFYILQKAGGPFIGPRGGLWADAKHTQPWGARKGSKKSKSTSIPKGDQEKAVERLTALSAGKLRVLAAEIDFRKRAISKRGEAIPRGLTDWEAAITTAMNRIKDKGVKPRVKKEQLGFSFEPIPDPKTIKLTPTEEPALEEPALEEPSPVDVDEPVASSDAKEPETAEQRLQKIEEVGEHVFGSRKDLAQLARDVKDGTLQKSLQRLLLGGSKPRFFITEENLIKARLVKSSGCFRRTGSVKLGFCAQGPSNDSQAPKRST